MSLANLGDLEGAIADWLYRKTDPALALRAGDLIALFESDFTIDPDMRPIDMEEVDTAPIEGAILPLPGGFLDMKLVQVLSMGTTPSRELTFVPAARASQLDNLHYSNPWGLAKHYTIRAGCIYITPQKYAPIGATLELTYNKFLPLAQADGGTNWLLQKYPNLYLYGSLMHAAAYVDDKETVVQWKAARDEAMAKLSKLIPKQKLGAGPLCMTPSSTSYK